MDRYLTCPLCQYYFNHPVILPCGHSVCLKCGQRVQKSIATASPGLRAKRASLPSLHYGDGGQVTRSKSVDLMVTSIVCPVCVKKNILADRGVQGLARNCMFEALIDKLKNQKISQMNDCQLCEKTPPTQATRYCEQCHIAYCDNCCAVCHPKRGPLANHTLTIIAKSPVEEYRHKQLNPCAHHPNQLVNMFCATCSVLICCKCLEVGGHSSHDTRSLDVVCKKQKTNTQANLNILKTNVNDLQIFIGELTECYQQYEISNLDLEASIAAQFDLLINQLQKKKEKMLSDISNQQREQLESLSLQNNSYKQKLEDASVLVSFIDECLKTNDCGSFIQVADNLNTKINDALATWKDEIVYEAAVEPPLDVVLDSKACQKAVTELCFIQKSVPMQPEIIADECRMSNNNLTVCWRPPKNCQVEGYILELMEDGQTKYKEIYRGRECKYTARNLHFDTTYNARVRAYNKAGISEQSVEICQGTTPKVMHFIVDDALGHPDIKLYNDNTVITCSNSQDRVILGSVGVSRGVHYWEVCIDRYVGDPDPAVGVAYLDANRDSMLGRDTKSWAMYVDSSRSWFKHDNVHTNRCEGGVITGSTVGVLLDMDRGLVRFYINGEPHGPVAYKGLSGTIYPAFSLNNKVQMSIRTGLSIPSNYLISTK